MFVRGELDRLGFCGISVEVNEIQTGDKLSSIQYDKLRMILQQAGIELFEDKKDILVQRIKQLIMEIVYDSEEPLVHNLSTYLSENLHHEGRSSNARQFSKAAINFSNVLPAVFGGMRAVTSERAMCACVP